MAKPMKTLELYYPTIQFLVINYIVILGKSYLWTCRCRKILPSLSHFMRILVIKYETEKLVYFKLNKANWFKEKWKIFEEKSLSNI